MRLAEDKVKQAILHPVGEIRLRALEYFADAQSDDDSLMPLAIEAVERYGRESAFQLLRRADCIRQTPETIDWLIGELKQDFDTRELLWDNYSFAAGLILLGADPDLLVGRRSEIVAAPCFPNRLAPHVDERLRFHSSSWQSLWGSLVEFCDGFPDADSMPLVALRRASQLVEALARRLRQNPQEKTEFISRHPVPRTGNSTTLAAFEIRLAGAMKAESLVPWLIATLHDGPTIACDECVKALIRIGTDDVVRQLLNAFARAGGQFRRYVSDVLGCIRSDLAADACRRLFKREEELEAAIAFAYAWLDQFDDRAIEPVHRFVEGLLDEHLDAEVAYLFHTVVSTSMITGKEFPGFDEWKEVSEKANWGRGNRRQKRISDSFFEETKTLRDAILEMARSGNQQSSSPETDDELGEFEDDFVERPRPATHTLVREMPKVGRNDPCPCGSGKKYKKCCLHRRNGGSRSAR